MNKSWEPTGRYKRSTVYDNVTDTVRIVCGTRSAIMSSVRLSVCPIVRPPHSAAAGLLLWARRAGDSDRLLHGRAHSSKCEQCHVVISRRKLNTAPAEAFRSPVLWTARATCIRAPPSITAFIIFRLFCYRISSFWWSKDFHYGITALDKFVILQEPVYTQCVSKYVHLFISE